MADESARRTITEYLQSKGLGELGDWAWSQYLEHGSTDLLYLQIQDRPEYKRRFAGRLALAEMGRAISEDQQIEWEQQVAGLMRAAGMPPQFYDSWEDFQPLIAAGKSVSEMGRLINEAYLSVTQTPPEVRRTFGEWYGADSDAALAAYFLDPEKALPAITQQVISAQLGGELLRQGITIQRGLAEKTAKIANTQELIQQGVGDFAQLYKSGLFDEMVGEQDLTFETGIAGTLGQEAQSTRDIQRRVNERKATTEGGTSTLATQQGVTGAGSAPKT